jgi:EmrB/QacA subfamily drug resistance transporter
MDDVSFNHPSQDTHANPLPVRNPSPDSRRWWALAATCFGLFMAVLDVTIVNVALPTISVDLHASFADLQWVVSAYSLMLAVLLITAGRMGDLFGRKRVFLIGTALFCLGSLVAAMAGTISIGALSSIHLLIAARAFQGVGGAVMTPLPLAIIAATFTGTERGIAIGIYGAMSGLAVAIGPLIGGILVENVGWQAIFSVNIPIGIIGSMLTIWAVRESHDEQSPRTIDFFGVVTLSISLFCVMLALIQVNDADKGWTSPYIIALFGIGAVVLLMFIIGELRQPFPMIDVRLFAIPRFTGTALVAFSFGAGLLSLLFFLTLYLQNYLGFTPLEAGLRTLPLSALILLAAPLGGVLQSKIGSKWIMVVGMFALVGGEILLSQRLSTDHRQDAWLILLPMMLLCGFGSGWVSPQIATVAVNAVSPNQAGMASGISGFSRQIGIAFGVALLGAILSHTYNQEIQNNIAQLAIPGSSPALQQTYHDQIITGLQKAGTTVGSTGLQSLPSTDIPASMVQLMHSLIFPQVQMAVCSAYITGMQDVIRVAILLLAIGLLMALFLVRIPQPNKKGKRMH